MKITAFTEITFRNELTKIADLCKKYNVLCLSDEVYEWIVYDNKEHIRICKQHNQVGQMLWLQ